MFRILLLSLCFIFFVDTVVAKPMNGDENTFKMHESFYGHELWAQKKFDTFISYKRCDGKHLASLIQARLQLRKIKAFLDVRDLCNDKFDTTLFNSIENSKSFILVLTKAALKDLMDYVYGYENYVYQELKYAIENKKNIIPVFEEGVSFPSRPIKLLDGIRKVAKCNGIEWNHKLQDATIDTIISFIKRGGSCIEDI